MSRHHLTACAALALFACDHTITSRVPELFLITPPRICGGGDRVVRLVGANFDPLIESLEDGLGSGQFKVVLPDVSATQQGAFLDLINEVWIDDRTLDVTVPATVPTGLYTIAVQSPFGEVAVRTVKLEVLPAAGTVTVTGVDPGRAFNGDDTRIAISGTGFSATAAPSLLQSGAASPTLLTNVVVESATRILATVPKGFTAGLATLSVVDASGCGGQLPPTSFRITETKVPQIAFVAGDGFTDGQPLSTVVCGANFAATSALLVADPSGAATAMSISAAPVGACPSTLEGITVTTANAVSTGTYRIRISSTADTVALSEKSGIMVTSPSPTLSMFTTLTGALTQPRRGAAVVAAQSDGGSRFVYAIGGDAPTLDGEGKSYAGTSTVRASVEMAQVVFDDATRSYGLGPFVANRTALPEGRFGARAIFVEVTDKRFIYVLGGNSGSSNATPNVVRALVLPVSQKPRLSPASVAAGVLPAGTYLYSVAAIMDAADADNPGGEALPSDRAAATFADPSNVTLSFAPVTGAVAYRIYRTPAPPDPDAGIAGKERLLVELTAAVACPATPCTHTDSVEALGAGTPLVPGSLGSWHTVAANANGGTFAMWGMSADFYKTSATPGRAGYIYLAGGTATGAFGSAQMLTLPVRSDGGFDPGDASLLPGPTFWHASTLMFGVGTPARDRLYVLFGRPDPYYHTASITAANGGLSAFGTDTSAGLPAIVGSAAISVGKKAFLFGGLNHASQVIQSTVQEGSTVISGNFSGFLPASQSLQQPRFLAGAVRIGGFIFIVGGFTNGLTLGSIERVQAQ